MIDFDFFLPIATDFTKLYYCLNFSLHYIYFVLFTTKGYFFLEFYFRHIANIKLIFRYLVREPICYIITNELHLSYHIFE